MFLDREEGKRKMASDPFRMVKVSDFLPVDNVFAKIVYVVNKKKKRSKKESLGGYGGVYQIFEMIKQRAVFEATMNIDTQENKSEMKHSIDREKFYADNLQKEITPVDDAVNANHKVGIWANQKFKDRFQKDAFLINLCRQSDTEAVTIEKNIKLCKSKIGSLYILIMLRHYGLLRTKHVLKIILILYPLAGQF